MASTKDYLDFVLEQMTELQDVMSRAMMGEYIIYYRGKIIGGIYDNRLLVKPIKIAHEILPNAPLEIPYPGGSPMLLVEDIENRDLLINLFTKMYPDLPEPRAKKHGKNS